MVDQGSTFYVEIPFGKSLMKMEQELKLTVDRPANLAGLHVLVVEDNAMNQFVVKKMLDSWQSKYVLANNGSEAIALLSQQEFDVVLMDLQMPEMSGYQATERIRSKHTSVKNPDVPIIALTADAFPETKIKVLETGMNDFITKPFKKEELYAKIAKLCL
jgi:CheY-like chemotaxis protein